MSCVSPSRLPRWPGAAYGRQHLSAPMATVTFEEADEIRCVSRAHIKLSLTTGPTIALYC